MSGLAIFLNILFLAIGIGMLVKGADWFVEGASNIAEKFGIPQIVIGLTIVAFGTSLPEAAVSINASATGSAAIAIGNVLGSNIANVLLILGICGLISPLTIKKNTLWIEIPFVIFISVILLILGIVGNSLSRIDGVILMLLFIVFLVYLVWVTINENKLIKAQAQLAQNLELPHEIKLQQIDVLSQNHNSEGKNLQNYKKNFCEYDKDLQNDMANICNNIDNNHFNNNDIANNVNKCSLKTICPSISRLESQDDAVLRGSKKMTAESKIETNSAYKKFKEKFDFLKKKNVWIMLTLVLVGGALVVFGSTFVVDTAKALAKNWGMSEGFIALTIVAIGTSLPELVTSVVASKKKKADLAIGNIVGSNIFNILFILGTAALVKPLVFEKSFMIDCLIAIFAMVLLLCAIAFTKDKKVKKIGGGVMLATYVGYFIYLITTIV